jgi:hypothetical protein
MDANQIFATGGASGLVGIMGYLTYRFFFSKHRIVSRCCGKEVSLEVDGSTPKNNISPLLDELPQGSSDESECPRERKERSQSPQGRNQERVLRGQEDDQVKREDDNETGVQERQGESSKSGDEQSGL